jgi:hypothetical protein
MLDRLMAILALAVLAAFLGILIWYVPRASLVGVVLVTYALVLYDFSRSEREQ